MRAELAHMAKVDSRASALVASLLLPDLDELAFEVIDDITEVRFSAGAESLAQLGVDTESGLVEQVNELAVKAARARAAEMVGRRFNAAGDLVENPDARWRIDEATRDMVRDAVAGGLEENLGLDAIVEAVMATGAFSEERAQLIAETEIGLANSGGALDGYLVARDDAGVDVRKEWLTAEDDLVDEDICQANAEQGPIDLDEAFQSGHMSPLGHPRCRCALVPVVADEGDSRDESDA